MVVIMHYSRALFRIVITFIGIIITAIVVSTRQSTTVLLLNTDIYGTNIYAKTAGLEIVGYIITFIVGLLTGGLCGIVVNLFMRWKQRQASMDEFKLTASNSK